MSSLSQAIVFRVNGLRKHENADNLMIGEFEGCPFIVNKNDTHEGDLRIFLPFDLIVPNREDMPEFVRGKRIRPMRLRGIFSMGACIPLPEGCEVNEGDDVTELLGFTKWIPPEEREDNNPDSITLENTKTGYSCSGPSGLVLHKYDLESLRKYHHEFTVGEPVIISEKLEGENISIVYWDGKLYVRSRNRWIAEGDNKWWTAVRRYDWSILENWPGLVAQGEKYGNVNKFRYDCANGEEKIRLFDLYDANKGEYLDYFKFEIIVNMGIGLGGPGMVPLLYEGPWLGLENHKDLAEGNSTIGQNIREGFVVQPKVNRLTRKFQRVKYKYHSEEYLIFKGKMK